MSYLALARRWRPRTFSEVVGQDHVTKPLINALIQGRLHHAYLFTGTRGVGKTSLARLLAKALNCEQNITAEPCLNCSACVEIEQGAFIDLIEVDGASRTRVEDTRDLLENILYLPSYGRFKIYLIDEVHMLSQHSFNALLKTLEEPPAHVKFILATTEPNKLPATILSRCLQFHLRHLPKSRIQTQLSHVLRQEQYRFDESALALLASAAKGSMRDALSLLEQAMSSASETVSEEDSSTDKKTHTLMLDDVREMLGYTDQDYALQLLQALAANNPLALLRISRRVALQGGYFNYVLDELLYYLHKIMMVQHLSPHIPEDAGVLTEESDIDSNKTEISHLASALTPEDIQLFYHIGLKGAEEMQLAPAPDLGFEMMLFRMLTFKPAPALNPASILRISTTQGAQPNDHQLMRKESESSILPSTITGNTFGALASDEAASTRNDPMPKAHHPNTRHYETLRASMSYPDGPYTSELPQGTSTQEPPPQAIADLDTAPSDISVPDTFFQNVSTQGLLRHPLTSNKNASNEPVPASTLNEYTANKYTSKKPHTIEPVIPTLSTHKLPEQDISSKKPKEESTWQRLLPQLHLQGFALLAAQNSELVGKIGQELTLRTSKGHFSLFTPSVIQTIELALSTHYNEKIRLKLIQTTSPLESSPAAQQKQQENADAQAAKQSLAEDAFCQQLQKTFSAELCHPEIIPSDTN